jgi:hypothetical protein
MFVISRVSADIEVLAGLNFDKFVPIDAQPQVVPLTQQAHRLSAMDIFASPLVRTEEIIVEPQSVAECLEHIRRLQAPELAEIRKRNREDGAVQQRKFHAQILSIET